MKRLVCGSLITLALVAWTLTGVAQGDKPFVPVTDEMLWKPNPADWLTWRRTLDSWGFSPLNQINKSNVAQMKMTWTRGMGPGNVQEATPLIYNGVMYLPNPNDLVQALDARTGDLLWQYQRKLPADLGKFMSVPRPSIATWRSTATRSSTRAPTTTSSRSTPGPARWRGKRRSSTTRKARSRARVRSSPTARSSPAAVASPRAARTPA